MPLPNIFYRLDCPKSSCCRCLRQGAISGVTLGTVLGSAYLMLRRRMAAPAVPEGILVSEELQSRKHILRRLIAITVPIAIGSSVMSVTNLVDTSVVLDRLLAAGFSQADAETMFGAYSGMARTLFNLPTALIIPIGISVIPAIAHRFSVGDKSTSSGILGSAPAACHPDGAARGAWALVYGEADFRPPIPRTA